MTRARQHGMAVVGALLVVAAASVTATHILERQSLLADTLTGERDRAQARWLLRGGLDWARVILLNDARHNAVTLKNALWAQPIAGLQIAAPGSQRQAYFSGVIEDEQGKYNLARLALSGSIQPVELASLERLLGSLGMAPRFAIAIAQRVAASQGEAGGPPSAPALRSVDELLGVAGMDLQTVAALKDYLSVLPASTALNVNTAPAEVLSIVMPGIDLANARRLVEARDQGLWFNSRGDFLNRLEVPVRDIRMALDVRSDWFRVSGQVRLDHATVGMTALLQRQGTQAPLVHWIGG